MCRIKGVRKQNSFQQQAQRKLVSYQLPASESDSEEESDLVENSSFVPLTLNGYQTQILCDTGNLSNVDLISTKLFLTAYPDPNNRPAIQKIESPIRTAGQYRLAQRGKFEAQFKIGSYGRTWQTQAYLVDKLGVPAILSANSIAKMPMVIDLGSSVAHIGQEGFKVPMEPLKIRGKGPKPRPSVESEIRPPPDGHPINCLKEGVDLGEAHYTRLARDLVIQPGCFSVAKIYCPKDSAVDDFYFERGQNTLSRNKLVCDHTALFRREEVNDQGNSAVQNFFYISVMNPTREQRRIRQGQIIGTHREVLTEITNLHTYSEPLKLLPIPDLSKLKTKQQIIEALDNYAGPNQIKDPKKLKEMREKIDEINKNQIKDNKLISPERKELLYHLLLRFDKVLSKSQYDVGKTDLIEFEVDTGDATPIKDKTRPMNPAIQEALRKHLQDQLREGIIAPGSGAWASAVVPVLKKTGEWRFASDYRRVNNVTKTDSYPIAHQQMAVASEEIGKAESFISLDLAGAYLAVPVAKDSQDKLAVTTCEGLFKCLRMPFGPKNACGCYARLMKLVFNDMMMRKENLSFFDDHLIPCPDFVTGLFRLAKFLYAVEKANLRVSLKKSHFFVDKVDWLGFTATAGSLLPSDRHVKKVLDWPVPKTGKDIRSFQGLASYYRRFMKSYALVSKPLVDAVTNEDKTGEFKWTPECQKSFDWIKKKLASEPILAHPDFEKEFILDTDASNYAMGAVLSQVHDGKERVILYASKLFNPAQRNYAVTRKELLAIVTFMNELRYFLLGKKFIVRTDHAALTWLRTSMNLTGSLFRWNESISDFDFEIQHRPGRKHGNADALSRYPYSEEDKDKCIPSLTELDKEMYAKCGIPPPKRGSLHKKLFVGALQDDQVSESHDYNSEEQIYTDHRPTRSSKVKARQNIRLWTKSKKPSDPDSQESEALQPGESEYPEVSESEFQGSGLIDTETNPEEPLDQDYDPSKCQCSATQYRSEQEQIDENLFVKDREEGVEVDELNPIHANVINRNALKSYQMNLEQRKDPVITEVISWVMKKQKPAWQECHNQSLKEYYRKYDKLYLDNDILYVLENTQRRLCIPEHLVMEFISVLHKHPLAGHTGRYRTYKQATRLFYWPSMSVHIDKAIRSCSVCLRAKKRKPDKFVPLGQTSTAVTERLTVFYADLVGPWIKTPIPGKYQYLLTLVDAVTKYPEAYPIYQATSQQILKVLLTQFIPRYGSGIRLITDQGRQFTSYLFQHACDGLGLIRSTTQAYEPHSNPVERMHRTLESTIRALMLQDKATRPSSWSEYVPAALASIRQSPLSNQEYSPYYLLHGKDPIVPAQVMSNHLSTELPSAKGRSVLSDVGKIQMAMDKVRKRQAENHQKNKVYYDKKVREQPLKEGDWVSLYTPKDKSALGGLRKTSTYYQEGYRVIDIINDRKIKIQRGNHVEEVSRDRLMRMEDFDISQAPTSEASRRLIESHHDIAPTLPAEFQHLENIPESELPSESLSQSGPSESNSVSSQTISKEYSGRNKQSKHVQATTAEHCGPEGQGNAQQGSGIIVDLGKDGSTGSLLRSAGQQNKDSEGSRSGKDHDPSLHGRARSVCPSFDSQSRHLESKVLPTSGGLSDNLPAASNRSGLQAGPKLPREGQDRGQPVGRRLRQLHEEGQNSLVSLPRAMPATGHGARSDRPKALVPECNISKFVPNDPSKSGTDQGMGEEALPQRDLLRRDKTKLDYSHSNIQTVWIIGHRPKNVQKHDMFYQNMLSDVNRKLASMPQNHPFRGKALDAKRCLQNFNKYVKSDSALFPLLLHMPYLDVTQKASQLAPVYKIPYSFCNVLGHSSLYDSALPHSRSVSETAPKKRRPAGSSSSPENFQNSGKSESQTESFTELPHILKFSDKMPMEAQRYMIDAANKGDQPDADIDQFFNQFKFDTVRVSPKDKLGAVTTKVQIVSGLASKDDEMAQQPSIFDEIRDQGLPGVLKKAKGTVNDQGTLTVSLPKHSGPNSPRVSVDFPIPSEQAVLRPGNENSVCDDESVLKETDFQSPAENSGSMPDVSRSGSSTRSKRSPAGSAPPLLPPNSSTSPLATSTEPEVNFPSPTTSVSGNSELPCPSSLTSSRGEENYSDHFLESPQVLTPATRPRQDSRLESSGTSVPQPLTSPALSRTSLDSRASTVRGNSNSESSARRTASVSPPGSREWRSNSREMDSQQRATPLPPSGGSPVPIYKQSTSSSVPKKCTKPQTNLQNCPPLPTMRSSWRGGESKAGQQPLVIASSSMRPVGNTVEQGHVAGAGLTSDLTHSMKTSRTYSPSVTMQSDQQSSGKAELRLLPRCTDSTTTRTLPGRTSGRPRVSDQVEQPLDCSLPRSRSPMGSTHPNLDLPGPMDLRIRRRLGQSELADYRSQRRNPEARGVPEEIPEPSGPKEETVHSPGAHVQPVVAPAAAEVAAGRRNRLKPRGEPPKPLTPRVLAKRTTATTSGSTAECLSPGSTHRETKSPQVSSSQKDKVTPAVQNAKRLYRPDSARVGGEESSGGSRPLGPGKRRVLLKPSQRPRTALTGTAHQTDSEEEDPVLEQGSPALPGPNREYEDPSPQNQPGEATPGQAQPTASPRSQILDTSPGAAIPSQTSHQEDGTESGPSVKLPAESASLEIPTAPRKAWLRKIRRTSARAQAKPYPGKPGANASAAQQQQQAQVQDQDQASATTSQDQGQARDTQDPQWKPQSPAAHRQHSSSPRTQSVPSPPTRNSPATTTTTTTWTASTKPGRPAAATTRSGRTVKPNPKYQNSPDGPMPSKGRGRGRGRGKGRVSGREFVRVKAKISRSRSRSPPRPDYEDISSDEESEYRPGRETTRTGRGRGKNLCLLPEAPQTFLREHAENCEMLDQEKSVFSDCSNGSDGQEENLNLALFPSLSEIEDQWFHVSSQCSEDRDLDKIERAEVNESLVYFNTDYFD